jgi:hypothetical protein
VNDQKLFSIGLYLKEKALWKLIGEPDFGSVAGNKDRLYVLFCRI